jgi:hypothetical protein
MFLSDPRETDVTFGLPGDNTPFSFSLRDAFSGNALSITPDGEVVDAEEVAKKSQSFLASVRAAERQTRLVDTINARDNALAEAADHRIRIVREQTGIELENPFRGGYELDARERLGVPLTGADPIALSRLPAAQRDIFNEKVDEAAQNHPDKARALTFGQSLEEQAQAIAQSAAYDGEHAMGGVPGFFAAVAGGLWGSRRDPLFLGSLFAGPGVVTTARTALSQIGLGAIRQGLFNAGLQALAQPTVQDWRREIGERNGVVPAIENVGMAFVFGAIPGAAIEGVRVVNAGGRAAISRIMDGTATPEDVRTAADALGVRIDDATMREIRTAGADAANDAAGIGEPPPGVAAAQHAEISAQAVRHAEDPASNPPPEIPAFAPARPASQARVIDETLPARPGDFETVDGKPVTFERFDPQALTTDAAAFQYKGGGDAAGVTDRLRHVTRWDPLASGKTLVFERSDGIRVIADGHQRLGLAKRLGEGDAGVKLDGFLFRERDGWTPEDVRALAAKKNMQEGSGDAIDAARVLRDRPDLLDGSLPITSPMMKSAIALARLSDEAFGMAVNGVVPPNYAAAVGSMVPDRLQHAGVLADLVRFAPETEREARLLIGEILSAGFRAEEQISLFGAAPAARSLMGERVKVLDAAMVGLSRDKRLFGTLADQADAIEAAGNQLARDSNDARARDAARLQDMLTRLARRTGPVSDALNRAAAQMAEGARAGKAAETFLDDVRALLDRDGLNGLLASPELKPAAIVEPGTPDSLAVAETASASRMETASPRPSLSQEAAIGASLDFLSGQRGVTVEQLHGRAAALQARIASTGREAADASGALFVNPGQKKFETLTDKITRKGYRDAGQITDAARGGLIVDTPEQAEAAIAALGRHFELLDEGWKVNREGYVDRKVLVRGADGTIGEIQIIPAPMYEAKNGGGQKLYTQSRSMPEGAARAAIDARQREIYSAASARLDAAWSGILEMSSGPNIGSNARRHDASGMTAAVWATSSSSTLDQPSPRASTANAARVPPVSGSESSTAGRKSQLQNVSSINPNLGASREAGKLAGNGEPGLFESIAVASREDGRDVRFLSREAALAEADKPIGHADLVANCKG